jgi:HK97 family phage prohead protease
MLLRKTLAFDRASIKMDASGFAGYASVFGGTDAYNDTIVKGAFESTLRTNGKPKMFFNHDWDSIPIGKWVVAKEDDHGLYVEGEFTPGLAAAADVRAAMQHGTIDGLSIGGFVKKGDYDETENGRVIRKWSRLVEVSPVMFPADGAARVDLSSVKGADLAELIGEIDSERSLESFLRDAGGLSKGAAIALTARIKALRLGEPVKDELGELAARLNALSLALPAST